MDGVLCIKEQRRVATDNTVQYRGQTLQLFPSVDHPSYARARVEVQERLDGSTAAPAHGVVVSYRGRILTPGKASPLAAVLRALANAGWAEPCVVVSTTASVPDGAPADPATPREPQPRVIWYEDSAMMLLHRERVKAGMERARQRGKRIGQPKVTEWKGFPEHLAGALARLETGELSRRQAAQELGIGYATLKRLLDARTQFPGGNASVVLPTLR